MLVHRQLSPSLASSARSRGASDDATASYPSRDVTVIVPFGAGGGSDVLEPHASPMSSGSSKLVPVNLLVENRPGASGAIGYTYVAKQAGNPYTLATVSVSFFTTPLLGASEVTYKNFTPVAAIAMSPYIMAVRAASPIKSFEDVKKARRLTTGTVGVVSDPVLLARMLQNATGVTIDTVPFDGEGEVMTAVLGGHIDFMLGQSGRGAAANRSRYAAADCRQHRGTPAVALRHAVVQAARIRHRARAASRRGHASRRARRHGGILGRGAEEGCGERAVEARLPRPVQRRAAIRGRDGVRTGAREHK